LPKDGVVIDHSQIGSRIAAALGLPTDDAPWSAIWRQLSSRVQDGAANTNNRFAVASELNSVMGVGPGPFWGCPTQHETSFLRATKRGQWDFPYSLPTSEQLKRLRETERRMKGVQETWKLFGVGSVGSQALLGIPCLARLRDHPGLAAHSRVWPFETGFALPPLPESIPFVLHVEIWPGLAKMDGALHPVRDAALVMSLARHLAEVDVRGNLGDWFSGPSDLSPAGRAACISEEGWILGAA